MKKVYFFLTCFLLSTLMAFADGPFREHRYDGFKVATINQNSIVFIGNSITNMHDWHSAFANHNVVNRGVSGGYATEILANLESYIAGKPAQVFLMIGTNDMAPNGLSHSPEQIAGNIRKIVDRIQNESPQTAIRLTSIFPSTSTGRSLEKIQEANALIKALAEERDLVYIDLYNDLQGILNNTHSRDGLHLSMSGYRIWCNKVAEYVGSECVYPESVTNFYPTSNGTYNMRVSCWSATPVKSTDILFIGDEMMSSGEFHEMLGNGNVKNFGTGWGYPGPSFEITSASLEAIFTGGDNAGKITKEAPAKVFLYTGVAEVNGSTDLTSVESSYQNILNRIHSLAPSTKVYLMSLQPTGTASINTGRVVPFNTWLKGVADANDWCEYVDIYSDFVNTSTNVGKSEYFVGNYIYGLGYNKVAQVLAPYVEDCNVMTDAEAEAQIALLNARNTLGTAISNLSDLSFGDATGQYPEDQKATIETAISDAYAVLNKTGVTVTELETAGAALTEKVNSIKSSINQPKVSTETEEHWYKITSPLRGNRIITSTGAGAGILGEATHNYATCWWKFELRTDGKYNIINRADNSYIAPTAATNSQLTTSATAPDNGWELKPGDESGLYIVVSGSAQFNQTQESLGWKLYNWGNGTNTNDLGCQLAVQEAVGEPDAPAALPEALLTASNINLNGTAPYKFEDAVATAVMNAGSVTVAVDYTLSSGADSEQCLFGSSNSDQAASFSCLNANPSTGKMLARFNTVGGKYTMNGVAGTNRTKVIITMSTSGYKLFVNGNNTATINHSSARNLGSYDGANGLYLGGLVTSDNNNLYPMTGTIHSIRIFPGQLTDAQIALIDFDESGTNPDPDPDPETPEATDYTIDKANGNLYHANGSANQNWNCVWKSTATPQLQFGCGTINNMNWSGNNVQLMTGSAGSATYSITPPTGYIIEDYSFTFVNNSHGTGLTLTMDNGDTYTTSQTEQTKSATGKKLGTVSFTLAGTNGMGVLLKNFTVKIKQGTPEAEENTAPVVSTEGDEHWYYIVNASSNKDYCRNKAIYYNSDNEKLQFANRVFSAEYIWSFWEKDGKLAIKNYNGEYFGTGGSGTGNSTAFGVVSEPNYIYNITASNGAFTIKDTGTELHAQQDNSVIVRWGVGSDGAASASLWRFDEVDMSNATAAVASTTVEQGKVTTGIGNKDQGIVRSAIRLSGLEGTCRLNSIKGKFTGTNPADVTKVKVYLASNDRELYIDEENKMPWREQNGELCAEGSLNEDNTFEFNVDKDLVPGNNYVWIAYDIAENAKEGNTVDAQVLSYVIDNETRTEANGNPEYSATIFLSEGAVLMPWDMGVKCYRIPSITVTKDGTRLVTITDDRKNHNTDLPAHCYLVAQYSDDFGKSWTAPVTIAGTAETGGDYGHGDASIVTNRDNGDIIGIMTSAGTYGHGFFAGTAQEPPRWKTVVSHDNGETWETPVDHTDDLFGANCDNPMTNTWKSGFSGSGAALQKRDGTLVSSFVNRQADNSQHFYFFMSKDGGQNWYVSGTSGTSGADEPKTLERNNGDLAISVRHSGYNYHNVTSDDGATWHYPSQTPFTTGISGNACDGEYMVWCSTVEGNPWDIAFQTLPNSGSRQNVSIALSTDEGSTFGTPKTLCPRGSAYSAAVVLPDGSLGVYYEENGLSTGGFTMRFIRFSLDWASDGAYKFTEEAPFHPIVFTGISDVLNSSVEKSDNSVYDLTGRKATNSPKAGVYIKDGKKYIINK